jgi:hypothetical protein
MTEALRPPPFAFRLLAIGVAVFSVACPHAGKVPVPKDLDPQRLYQQIVEAHQKPESLTADAKAFVEAPVNGGRYQLHVSVKKPQSLRIEALMPPLGDPAAVLVSDGGKFALYDVRRQEFFQGPSTPQNLSKLFPVPFRDDELVSLFTGGVPELRGGAPTAAAVQGDGYEIVVAGGGEEQRVLVHQEDLRVLRVSRGPSGQPARWTVTLEEHDDGVPRVVKLTVPTEKITLDLRLRELLVGKPPPFGAFALQAPKGVKVIELP